MSSSRYRDDRSNGAYPPRHGPPPRDYYPSPSSSHPYDSRAPYASSSTYAPPPLDTGSRFAPPVGGRSFDDRSYSSYPSNGPAYASSSRYDDRRDRSGREYDDRSARDARTGDYRPRSPPPLAINARPTIGREQDRTRPIPGKSLTPAVGGPSDPRAASRSAYRDLSPPAIAPLPIRDDSKAAAPPSGKASYERSAKGQPSSTASTTVPLPQGSPEFEPGELVPTPKSNVVDLPPVSNPVPSTRSAGGGSTRGGDGYERSRAEPTWAGYPTSGYPSGSGYDSRGPSSYDSRYAREPAYAPPLQPLTYPPS